MGLLGVVAGYAVFSMQSDLSYHLQYNKLSAPESNSSKSLDELQKFNDSISFSRDVFITRIEGTGSMRPTLDGETLVFEHSINSSSEVHVGDIISYNRSDSDAFIIHRVIKIGNDSQGWFAVMKGDNNYYADGKIRESQLRHKVDGVIY